MERRTTILDGEDTLSMGIMGDRETGAPPEEQEIFSWAGYKDESDDEDDPEMSVVSRRRSFRA